ncbi:MAG TPA: hypothetical protein VFG49_11255 [Dyella sp.]|uniref:TolB family protein n=1 Tax=Dyella sp. TaxID=1869338 RepID=UPI002D78BFE9|nr:hypothetical protein [Dyella sp.]HET6554103.1 hypothetical protein [Dyella sp.]
MWPSFPVVLLSIVSLLKAAAIDPATELPVVFAPGVISGPDDDASPAFSPDGRTVVFMRGTDDGSVLMVSRRSGEAWSTPVAAPFSGQWRDIDPAMAPDGSFLLFVSNRPTAAGGTPLDATFGGKRRPGQGMNLWRVARQGDGWGVPARLPDNINTCPMTFAPSVAADGSVYYIGCAPDGSSLQLMRAEWQQGRYQAPHKVALGDAGAQIRDPAVAPDRSFMVFSIKHALQQPYRLAIAFHTSDGWNAPQDLGDAVNAGTHAMGAQLGCDHRSLYFYSDRHDAAARAGWNNGGDNIWRVSLAPWLDAHGSEVPPAAAGCARG